MTQKPVSVVVVSRERPEALTRCLTGISQLQDIDFEVVVVADPGGIGAAQALPFSAALKLVPFDEPNISAARNAGISAAAGEVLAFIDDDAVPEPWWLHHLTAPLLAGKARAAGGFVRGRNGITDQWRVQALDRSGTAVSLDLDPVAATVLTPPKGRAIKTEGTNMAFERALLVDLGGFDEAYAYFLDETDLNMRIAAAGQVTAIVPRAVVHHGFAPNRVRDAARVPRDLFDIGASWAVFHARYLPNDARSSEWARLRAAERARLLRHMVAGNLEPGAVRHLLKRLDIGYRNGSMRPAKTADLPAQATTDYAPFPTRPRASSLLHGRFWSSRGLQDAARARVQAGEIVTVIVLSPTALFHRMRFCDGGYWLQTGGIFGKSDRKEPVFRWFAYQHRIRKERDRIRGMRVK